MFTVGGGVSVDLTTNPSSKTSQLVVQANTLAYDVYSVNLRVDLIANATYNALYSTAIMYVQIVPTGLVVNALQNGVTTQLVGFNQAFVLEPALYSLDLDQLVANMSSLSFAFFCSAFGLSSNQNLFDCKTNPTACIFLANQTCFSSTSRKPLFIFSRFFYWLLLYNVVYYVQKKGDYSFDSSGNKLIVAAQALKYLSSSVNSYQFTVQTVYMGLTFSQQLSVQISGSYNNVFLASLKYI